jgi:hypothetical protein
MSLIKYLLDTPIMTLLLLLLFLVTVVPLILRRRAARFDVSPVSHPRMSRVCSSRPVEHRHVMFEPESHVGVTFDGLIPRDLTMRGFERKDLVAIRRGDFDAAIPVAMLHVGAAKDDEAALNLVDVLQEAHVRRLSTGICADSVKIMALSA